MIKPEQVPNEAAKAARKAMLAGWSDVQQIIAAAINAWPNGYLHSAVLRDLAAIILPLPQESGDETVP